MLEFSLCLLMISLWGLLAIRKNLISIIITLELLLLSSIINLITFSILHDVITGQLYALIVFAIAGAESAIGLAIVVVMYRLRTDISLGVIANLKG